MAMIVTIMIWLRIVGGMSEIDPTLPLITK